MKTIIGIDLGGTNVRVAKITEEGQILQELKSPSYAMEGKEKVVDNLIAMIKQIDNYSECIAIGIGVPGPVDTINNIMTLSSNLKGFAYYQFAEIIEKATGLKVYLDNDANVAGLAEAVVGAGKGHPIVYYVTISTGIGGALVINGKVISGKSGYAGEVGNLIVDRYRAPFNNLNPGAVESEAGGRAMIRKIEEKFGVKTDSAKFLFDKYLDNDPMAIEMVEQMTDDLAIAFSHIAHLVDPNIFVIGGGMMKSKDIWLPMLINKFQSYVHPGMRDVIFAQAELSEPGIIGAAMLPLSRGAK